MGTFYSHLSCTDRVYIEVFSRHDARASAIAAYLGRHRSTICRELTRCAQLFDGRYLAVLGQRYCQQARRRAGAARRKLGPDFESPAWLHLRQGLRAHLSPQEIAGRLKRSCIIPGSHLLDPRFVSHETIYCAIYAMPRGTLRSELVRQLCRSPEGRRPRRRGSRPPTLQDMTSIVLRPPEVAARTVPGHWEGRRRQVRYRHARGAYPNGHIQYAGDPMRILVLPALIGTLTVPSYAAPDHSAPARLTGTYSIGAASLTDPAPDDRKDVLLRLYLNGNAARDLFNAISTKPKRDECFDDGTLTKTSGELMCARHPKGTHECWIGIDLKKQALAAGFVC